LQCPLRAEPGLKQGFRGLVESVARLVSFEQLNHVMLAQHGDAVVGTVKSIQKKKHQAISGAHFEDTVTYEFQTHAGKTVTGKHTSGRMEAVREGELILVIYLSFNPGENKPFLNLTYEPIAP
jgi:hypothetical protein